MVKVIIIISYRVPELQVKTAAYGNSLKYVFAKDSIAYLTRSDKSCYILTAAVSEDSQPFAAGGMS